ncbi:MAG: hypothetical protein IT317_18545 [Anaerolineales bacterium]|nr:hypothetical protein [Anaerolineales bacterium]
MAAAGGGLDPGTGAVVTANPAALRRADTRERLVRLGTRLGPYARAAAWCALLALLWRFEAPSLWHTLAASFAALGAALALIEIGARQGYLASRNAWVVAFLLKLTLSFLITSYLWAEPLTKLNLLRVAAVVPGVQDSNLYDYQAVLAATSGFRLEVLNFTWQSFGIVTYLASIYRVFGVSVWYVALFNAVLALLGVIALAGLLTTLDPAHRRQWQWARFAMLIPYVAYFDATPAKEPLTFGLFYFTLLFMVRLIIRQGSLARNGFMALAGLAFLALVRPNVALLLLIPNILVLVLRLGARRGLAMLGLALLLVLGLMSVTGNVARIMNNYFNPEAWLAALAKFWADRQAVGDHPLKLLVGDLLLPRSLAGLVALAPVRAVVWFFLPYPIIVPNFETLLNLRGLLATDPIQVVLFGADLSALISTWLLILWSPFLAAAVFARRTWRSPGFKLILLNLFSLVLIISNIQFIMGRRYRTLLEPLIFAVALWGAVHGRPAKYQLIFYALLIGGVVIVELISFG